MLTGFLFALAMLALAADGMVTHRAGKDDGKAVSLGGILLP